MIDKNEKYRGSCASHRAVRSQFVECQFLNKIIQASLYLTHRCNIDARYWNQNDCNELAFSLQRCQWSTHVTLYRRILIFPLDALQFSEHHPVRPSFSLQTVRTGSVYAADNYGIETNSLYAVNVFKAEVYTVVAKGRWLENVYKSVRCNSKLLK